jgi:DNA polymerase
MTESRGVPRFRSLGGLNRALLTGPPFIEGAGRIVPGAGRVGAAIAFVGEQPGDEEDRQGVPFVGPAGRLLDEAMEQAGIERDECYLTNAVKQFNFVRRGKKRLHKRPSTAQIVHYRWWLELELQFVAPQVIVALGATAAFALAGRRLGVTASHGPLPLLGRAGYITTHPSGLLRIPDRAARIAARRAFVRDLKKVRRLSE